MTPLKARQERFCRRFAEFGCATTAARAAGYAPGSAKVAVAVPAAARRGMFTFVSTKSRSKS